MEWKNIKTRKTEILLYPYELYFIQRFDNSHSSYFTGIPPPGFPPPGPQGLLPPGIRPPAPGAGILPLPLNLPPNPNFLVQQQQQMNAAGPPGQPPNNPFFNNTDVPMDGNSNSNER